MYDLTVILPNTPGTLATMGEALAGAGINIQGGCVNIERTYLATGSRLAFVTDDNGKARAAIRA